MYPIRSWEYLMKIISDKPLRNFEFWSVAKENAQLLTPEQLDIVESILEDCYPDGVDETELNDIFWFDFDAVCDWINIDNK